jgi:hypothetical protein
MDTLLELLSWGFGFAANLAEHYDKTNVEGKRLIIGSCTPKNSRLKMGDLEPIKQEIPFL